MAHNAVMLLLTGYFPAVATSGDGVIKVHLAAHALSKLKQYIRYTGKGHVC